MPHHTLTLSGLSHAYRCLQRNVNTDVYRAPTGWLEKGKVSAGPLWVICEVSMLHQIQEVSCCPLSSCFAESHCPSAVNRGKCLLACPAVST